MRERDLGFFTLRSIALLSNLPQCDLDLDFVLMYRKKCKERKLLVKETKSNEKCIILY